MVFQLASTNLVIELGIIMIVLMCWQFAAVRVSRRPFDDRNSDSLVPGVLTDEMVEEATQQADKCI